MLALALLGVGVAPLLSQGTGDVAHGEGELIERVRAEGDGNFTVVRTAPSGAETQGYGGGLLIRVKDANGNPVTSGRVEVFDSPDSRDFSGSLGQSGEVFADVPDGTYTVIVSSFSPLFVVREGVQAPGTVDIDPEGTIAVSFQALDLDQNPINGYVVPRPGYRTTGSIGFTGSSGSPLDALITPRLYDAYIAWSWSDLYYLFLADRDINGTIGADLGVNGATDLTFSAALVDTGTLTIVDTPGFDGLSVTPFNQTHSDYHAPILESVEGDTVVLQADSYRINLGLMIGGSGVFNSWIFRLDALPSIVDIGRGSNIDGMAGGDFIV